MSRLLNHKRMRLSTPISQRYRPSKSLLRNQMKYKEHRKNLNLEDRLSSPQASLEPHVEHQTQTLQMIQMEKTNPLKSDDFLKPKCLGLTKTTNHYNRLFTPVARKPVGYLEPTTEISPKRNSSPRSPQIPLQESLAPNGSAFSRVTQSISTRSSPPCTMLSLMKRERVAWEMRRSLLQSLKQRRGYELLPNGLPHGGEPREQSPLLFPTGGKSYSNMEITSKENLLRNSPRPITESSSSMLRSEMRSGGDNTSSLPTLADSVDSTQRSSCPMALNLKTLREMGKNPVDHPPEPPNPTSAINSTMVPARIPIQSANIATSAKTAKKQDTERKTVRQHPSELYGLQPKYLRHNLWNDTAPLSLTSADWTEKAAPLPRPPLAEMTNPAVADTIAKHPDLFQITTPIRVDIFESLLTQHPNQAFVQSVCAGLREGFWPWADTLREDLPCIHDESCPMPSSIPNRDFIRSQLLLEQSKGRFSNSFGPDLLPGMYSMPVHAVPKPHSTDLRLVTDHSAGPFSLNSLIDHSRVTGYPLDNLHYLGEVLLDSKRSIGNISLTMWKSDIAEAYRLMPMSPYWQIKQINTVDGLRYVDRNLAFGSSASAAIFISFNSLVAWIAKNVKGFTYLGTYVDDSFGCDVQGDILYYGPYECHMPTHQKLLLDLWDEIGIPHKRHKQLSGNILTIIGIDVDPNAMTLTLSPSARNLIEEMSFWSSKPPNHSSGSFKLKHWEKLTGWVNWALNVYPLVRPALNNIYAKMSGKSKRNQHIYINNAIRNNLKWAINHIRKSDGVHLLKSTFWEPSQADVIIYCDACPEGLGFWYPGTKEGLYAPTPTNKPKDCIFYYESLCVLSALSHAQIQTRIGSKIVIYTDNTNTVDIFGSFRCLPAYNGILKAAVNIISHNDYSLRVLHIPGNQNIVADALSRVKFSVALEHEPSLKLNTFNPPIPEGSTV